MSDHDSKISLTNIDMADSEIFSNYLSGKSLKDKMANNYHSVKTSKTINNND